MANLHRFIRSVSPHDLRNPGSAEKAIIFTESRRTQEYLVRLLSRNAYDGKLVLFNGSNSDPQSKAIYDAWVQRHKGTDREDHHG